MGRPGQRRVPGVGQPGVPGWSGALEATVGRVPRWCTCWGRLGSGGRVRWSLPRLEPLPRAPLTFSGSFSTLPPFFRASHLGLGRGGRVLGLAGSLQVDVVGGRAGGGHLGCSVKLPLLAAGRQEVAACQLRREERWVKEGGWVEEEGADGGLWPPTFGTFLVLCGFDWVKAGRRLAFVEMTRVHGSGLFS